MINKWVIGFVISFILRQLEKWQLTVDWEKVKADLKPRIEALIPGSWFDQSAVDLVFTFIDVVADVLAATGEIEAILKLVGEQKYQEAWEKLRDLILGNLQPINPEQELVKQMVEDCKTIV
jgi:hypothetical protein